LIFYTGVSLFVLKKRYITALVTDLDLLVTSKQSRKPMLKKAYREFLMNLDIFCMVIFSEIIGSCDLGYLTIFQTETVLYSLFFPVWALTERLTLRGAETCKNSSFIIISK